LLQRLVSSDIVCLCQHVSFGRVSVTFPEMCLQSPVSLKCSEVGFKSRVTSAK